MDSDRAASGSKWTERFLKTWTVIGVALLAAAALLLIERLASVVTPFVFAALVVFLLRRPVNMLVGRGLSRAAAVTLCYVAMFAAVTFFGLVVLPPFARQLGEFIKDFPRLFAAARDLWFDLQRQYTRLEVPSWVEDALLAQRVELARQAAAWSRALASGVVFAGGQVFSFLLTLFLSLALAFFVLRDLPTIKAELLTLGGIRRRDELVEILERVTGVVEGWLRGQGLIALIVGLLTWAGLALLGVPYALIIGVIAGVTNLIPYLGPLVGGAVAAISAAFVSPTLVLYTVVYIVVLQQVESTFLQPRIMSGQVHLHPVVVVFSLLVGATVAGVLGMFLAVPVAGALNAVFVYYFEKHTASELATESGALFRRPPCDDEPPRSGSAGTEPEARALGPEDAPCERSDEESA